MGGDDGIHDGGDFAGLALLVLGIGFMVLEAFVPSFGALGIGGALAFVFGSVILFRDDAGQIGVAGANVTYGGVLIGTFVGGTDADTRAAVSLGDQGLLHNDVELFDLDDAPTAFDRLSKGQIAGRDRARRGSQSHRASQQDRYLQADQRDHRDHERADHGGWH